MPLALPTGCSLLPDVTFLLSSSPEQIATDIHADMTRLIHDLSVMIQKLTISYIQESILLQIVGYSDLLGDHNVPLLLNFVSITLF